MDLLDMIGSANAGSVWTHSYSGGRGPTSLGGGCAFGSTGVRSATQSAFPGSAYVPYPAPKPVLRGGRGCYGPTAAALASMGSVPVAERPGVPNTAGPLRGLSSPGSVPVQDRPGIPNTMPGVSLRTLRALRQQQGQQPTTCPDCKGCHPIFYLGTAAAAVMVLALILK